MEEEEKDKWRFINSINFDKKDLSADPDFDKDYNSYFINRSLSYHKDTLPLADTLNRYPDIPKVHQYLFLLNTVGKRKRFTKFVRKSHSKTEDENLSAVEEYFDYNPQKAKEVLTLLTPEQLAIIKTRIRKGGVNKNE